MKKLKERPVPITRADEWNDYMCFLLENILEELRKQNKVKTVTKTKG
jgi:hypothetical protein